MRRMGKRFLGLLPILAKISLSPINRVAECYANVPWDVNLYENLNLRPIFFKNKF